MKTRLSEATMLSPQEILRQAQQPPPPKPPRKRQCCRCNCDDRVAVVQGESDARGEPMTEHWVTIELRYLRKREDLTPRLRESGWRMKDGDTHQGRFAMERFICRPCMRDAALMEREWRSKVGRELKEGSNHYPYYAALCQENAE